MVEEAVVGACRGRDQIGNGAHIANLAERGGSLAARRGLILFDHAHQAVDRITIARHSGRARRRHANAKIGVIEGGTNAFFGPWSADPIEYPHGGGAGFV